MTLELSAMAAATTRYRSTPTQAEEDRLVAELELLGITYLSRAGSASVASVRAPHHLLSDLIRQPSARVREAIIAVLLLHPEFATAVPAAMNNLSQSDQDRLRAFYTAAVIVQEKYTDQLRVIAPSTPPLPDLFSSDLGLRRNGSPDEQLAALGQIHRCLTGSALNWAGTYDNAAQHLLKQKEREQRWNR